jgi:hypothetical protein
MRWGRPAVSGTVRRRALWEGHDRADQSGRALPLQAARPLPAARPFVCLPGVGRTPRMRARGASGISSTAALRSHGRMTWPSTPRALVCARSGISAGLLAWRLVLWHLASSHSGTPSLACSCTPGSVLIRCNAMLPSQSPRTKSSPPSTLVSAWQNRQQPSSCCRSSHLCPPRRCRMAPFTHPPQAIDACCACRRAHPCQRHARRIKLSSTHRPPPPLQASITTSR